MNFENLKVDPSKLLTAMSRDNYFPKHLVDQVREILLNACREIESQQPADLRDLYAITCRATEGINGLEESFEEHDSEIETVARDDIAESFGYIASVYGFPDADLEELVATRNW